MVIWWSTVLCINWKLSLGIARDVVSLSPGVTSTPWCYHRGCYYFPQSCQQIRSLIFTFLLLVFLKYWNKIALQWCVSFCCTKKWISYLYTHGPSPRASPYLLLTTPLGHHTTQHWAEVLVLCNRSHWLPISHEVMYIYQGYWLNSSPQSIPQLCP